VLLAPSAAAGAETFTTIDLAVSGALEVRWHGDPAAGCAAAAMCDYSGTTTFRLARSGELDLDHFAGETDLSGLLDTRGRSEARVTRALPGGGVAECRDGSSDASFTIDSGPAYRDRHSLAFGINVTPTPILNGSCAGPRLEEVVGALPTIAVRIPDVKRRGHRLDFSGRFPFRAGPLTGEVVSTVALRTTKVVKHRFDSGGGKSKTRTRKAIFVDVEYAVTGAHGAVEAGFQAVDKPICQRFDACGASGDERWSLTRGRGRLTVFGTIFANPRKLPKLKDALAMAARKGELDSFGVLRKGSGVTVDTLARPAVATCADSVTPGLPALSVDRRDHKPRLTFGDSGFAMSADATLDLLDGRCPGPTQGDVLQGSVLGSATIPPAALARRTLHVTVARRHRFSAGAYRGTERTHVELDLSRLHADVTRGEVSETTVIGGGGFTGGFVTGGPRQRP
jgi:hypothetical protein